MSQVEVIVFLVLSNQQLESKDIQFRKIQNRKKSKFSQLTRRNEGKFEYFCLKKREKDK